MLSVPICRTLKPLPTGCGPSPSLSRSPTRLYALHLSPNFLLHLSSLVQQRSWGGSCWDILGESSLVCAGTRALAPSSGAGLVTPSFLYLSLTSQNPQPRPGPQWGS